jgi:hypothetical protein
MLSEEQPSKQQQGALQNFRNPSLKKYNILCITTKQISTKETDPQ